MYIVRCEAGAQSSRTDFSERFSHMTDGSGISTTSLSNHRSLQQALTEASNLHRHTAVLEPLLPLLFIRLYNTTVMKYGAVKKHFT